MTSESQDTRLTSQPKRRHPTQGSVPNHCPGALGYFFTPEERVLLLTLLRVPPNTTSSSICSPIQDQPCLASEASQQRYAGWYAAYITTLSLLDIFYNVTKGNKVGQEVMSVVASYSIMYNGLRSWQARLATFLLIYFAYFPALTLATYLGLVLDSILTI